MSGIQQTLLGGAPSGGYQIERSLRFNSADSAYLNRTPASAGNRKTWTWSGWVKRSALSSTQSVFSGGDTSSNNDAWFRFDSGDTLNFSNLSGGSYTAQVTTSAVFRDVSAWYGIVLAVDTTQATGSNRVKIYINGVQQTVTFTTTPSQNSDMSINIAGSHTIGRLNYSAVQYLNGYLTEVNFIDGQALTPSSFGQNNAQTGVWEPIKYTGTYGTNGFYLNFSDNSGTTSTTLGKDYSGNANNWTPSGLSVTAGAGNDSLVDTPTPYGSDTGVGGEVRGNYITFNQLLNGLNYNAGSSLPNGSLQATTSTSSYKSAFLNMGITSGKWYCEFTWTAIGANAGAYVGVAQGSGEPQAVLRDATYPYIGSTATSYGYRSYDGQMQGPNDVTAAYGNSYATNDVIGVALDMDAGKVWFSKNGTWQNSGSPTGGTNAAKTGLTDIVFIGASYYDTNDSVYVNTGQRPFAYTAPSGFKALCTQNLPTPTIGATSTTQAGKYFNAVLYTGNGSTQTISGVGFQPDLVWNKQRSSSIGSNWLNDAVRGAGYSISSNRTDAEANFTSYFTAFNSDGFGLAGGTDGFNANTSTYVAWNWKANGAGSSNTDGTITSTVSANTTAGFSIVTYTGNGTSGATVGHGLGVAPSMIILKDRDSNSVQNNWLVWHTSLSSNNNLYLSTTDAQASYTSTSYGGIGTSPTSTTFLLGSGTVSNITPNENGDKYVAYCFAAVAGYSAFGSYTGNGSTDGPFIYTGFRPRWIMFKKTSATSNWSILDTARDDFNVADNPLLPNTSGAETTSTSTSGAFADILSNGFKLRGNSGDINDNTATYIYAAFCESPFKFSLAR